MPFDFRRRPFESWLNMTFPTTHPALARALAARNYSVPTAVQLAVLQDDRAGRDLLVSAQTGSGKTVAFGLAMAKTLLGDAERFERAVEPVALIIAPTRELALQVHNELVWLYADTGARIITCVGGMDVRAEARQLNSGAHIVVGTPGRLRDHLERKRLDLTKLKTIVLDEADEMLDLGFREDLEFILDATPDGRQTLLFSATMPREIETLARRFQSEAVRIETIRRDEQHADIEYQALRVVPGDAEHAIVNVLRFHEMRAALVFCATREAVKRTHMRLVERGFSAVALSGELTQAERTQALQAIRDGRARVLVATDVAARGLDLPDLTLVIHADLPNDGETLLHRSGRTGRAGKKGLCVLIVPFNKRRKADSLLSAAKVRVTWGVPPTADEIRVRDNERFMASAIFTDEPAEDDVGLARGLQAARTPEEIALALVRMHRAQLPAPEDLLEDRGPPKREDGFRPGRERFQGKERFESKGDSPRVSRDQSRDHGGDKGRDKRHEDKRFESGPRPPRGPREPDTREMVWFRLNIGREKNADPRWLLPLICKAGNISKAEIGTIKILDRDTRFQVVADHADLFADTVRTSKNKEGHISRVGPNTPADDEAVANAIDAITQPPAEPRKHRPSKSAASDSTPAQDTLTRATPSKDWPKAPSKAPWKDKKWKDHKKPKSDEHTPNKGASHKPYAAPKGHKGPALGLPEGASKDGSHAKNPGGRPKFRDKRTTSQS